MKRLISAFVFFALCATSFGQLRIVDVRPTPFFPKVGNGEPLKQIVQISVKNTGEELPVQVRIRMEDKEAYSEGWDTLLIGENTIDVKVLDITKPSVVKFELLNDKHEILAEKEMLWQAQKKWKVYYAAVSHQDLGFISYYQNLRRANREGGIDIALELCKLTDSWDENDKFRWNVETSEPLNPVDLQTNSRKNKRI